MGGVVIVRMGGEIGIKSRPVRSIYERMLAKIIQSSLKRDGIAFSEISRAAGRIYVYTEMTERASKRMARIFGISSASAGIVTGSELNEIVKKGTELAIMNFKPGTFAVKCRRSGHHEYTSMEVASLLGKAILATKRDLKVNLDNPDQTLYVEIRDKRAYLYLDSIKGPDGFPVGTQDQLLGIIDGTKESLLASWCMLKRGASLKAATYEVGSRVPEGALNNLKTLLEWIPNASLETFVVPLSTDGDEDLMGYKLCTAIKIARDEGIAGIVSGLRPRSIGSISPLSSLDVQIFFPLMALEDRTLDEWSRYIGIGEYSPDESVFGMDYTSAEKIVDKINAQCQYRKVTLSPEMLHF
ncbi:MAG: THUMP domain-containing protein [Candidatus Methanomethyliaceae archaeon]|nr:THUMP domain-containing protein [Candidatus Methanomethyliaceae archaeon]